MTSECEFNYNFGRSFPLLSSEANQKIVKMGSDLTLCANIIRFFLTVINGLFIVRKSFNLIQCHAGLVWSSSLCEGAGTTD